MRLILNVIWLVLAGFWMALGYLFAGVVCCVLIVTIPFGIASFRIANYALWPFGRTVVDRREAGVGSFVGNVIWFLVMRPVAQHRPPDHRDAAMPHDHRHPAGAGEFQDDPDLADAAGQGNRGRVSSPPDHWLVWSPGSRGSTSGREFSGVRIVSFAFKTPLRA